MTAHLLPLAAFLHSAVTAWTFGNQGLFPSDWSALKPLAEDLLGMTAARYLQVMEEDRMGYVDGITWDFVCARLLDSSRKGAWLLMFISLVSCACYVAYYLWLFILRPFLSPVCFLVGECCLSFESKRCLRRFGLGMGTKSSSLSFADARHIMEAHGMTTSYRLADNARYGSAFKALQHTHGHATQKVLREVEECDLSAVREVSCTFEI